MQPDGNINVRQADEIPDPTPGMGPGVATNSGGGNTSGAGSTMQPPGEIVPGEGVAHHPPVTGPVHPEKPGEDTTLKPVNEWMQDA